MYICIDDVLIENTFKLGTKIESYLQNFYDYTKLDKNSKSFSEFYDFLNKGKKGTKKRTIEQNKGIFKVFDILKNDEEFNNDFLKNQPFDEFKRLLCNKIQTKINNYNDFLEDKYFLSFFTSILINKNILSKNNYDEKLINYLKDFDLSDSKKEYNSIFNDLIINFTEKKFIEDFEKNKKIFFSKIEKKINVYKNYEKYNNEEYLSYKDKSNKKEISIINLLNFLKTKLREKDFSIPFYQRHYVWGENNINLLFNSILEKDIFLNLNSFHINMHLSYIKLVDGQQRLTSLILILWILLLKKENLNELINLKIISSFDFDLIKNNILYYFNLLKKHLDISNNEIQVITSNSILNKRKNKNKSLLYSNFEFIKKLLKNYSKEEQANILYKVLGIEFILVSESDSNDVLKFIELNSNSKPLTDYELSKSYLIFFSKEFDNKYDIEDKIRNFESKFSNNRKLNQKKINIFLSSYLKIKKLKNIKDSNYFLSFKEYTEELNDIEKLINDLKKYLNYFLIIYDDNWKINSDNKKLFDFINDILFTFRKQDIYLPILMYLLDLIYLNFNENKKNNNFIDKNVRIFLLKLEVFHFKWKIVSFRGDSLPEVMINLLKNINDKQNDDDKYDFSSCLEKKNVNFIKNTLLIDNKEFFEELKKFDFKNNDLALKIIVRIENAFKKINIEEMDLISSKNMDQNRLSKFDYASLTLEHIYPQKVIKDKIDDLEKRKNNLLNLMFLTSELNSSVGNNNPYDKYKSYKKNNVFIYNQSLKDFNNDQEKFNNVNIINTLNIREKNLLDNYEKILKFVFK